MSTAAPLTLEAGTPAPDVARAYDYCRRVTREHARSFYFCAHFLPREKRRAIYAVYALCRRVDDEVDEAGVRDEREARAAVERWRAELDRVYRDRYDGEHVTLQDDDAKASTRQPEASFHNSEASLHEVKPPSHGSLSPVLIAWRDMLTRHDIARELPLELMRGVLMDTYKKSYETWDELRVYCYRVASVVGLMSSEIFGYSRPETLRYAEALGLAMQLTNILRDVGEDLALGRVYLPREDLRRFGLDEDDLRRGEVSEDFRALARFEIRRARDLYLEAERGIPLLDADARFTVLLAARLYARILDEIERADFNVFTRRAHLTFAQKLRAVPRVWREARRF
ncbi:MAG TPA: phytoene/squalene synthase family protein [Pyrinomonadaceae bacterium]|nr:phytoene/squalene synthase family protein [Pyrinomonadaceae bacterium]